MGMTCRLVRLGSAELEAVRRQPIEVLGFISRDEPTHRWIDLGQDWLALVGAFEIQLRGDTLVQAILPGPPVFDDSAAGGETVTFAEPDVVRVVAGALGGVDAAALRNAAIDGDEIVRRADLLRDFYQRAAAERQAVAVVIG